MSGDEIVKIIDTLEGLSDEAKVIQNKRSAVRLPLPRDLTVVLSTAGPSGEEQAFLVHSRQISDTGIGFLHGGFLHLERKCVVDIYNGAICLASLPGVMIRCRHITGMVHEAAVKFDRRINAQDLTQKKIINEENAPEIDSLPRLKGQVLYLDHIEADRRYDCLRMTQMGVSYTLSQDINSAMQILQDGGIDLVICELRLKPDPAQYLIRRMKQSKSNTPIVVTGNSIGTPLMKELRDLGAQACLIKPYRPNQIADMLKEYLKPVPEDQLSKKIGTPSEYWSDTACRPLIVEYIAGLKLEIEKLSDLKFNEVDLELLTASLKQTAATASIYGYPKISEITKELEMILNMGSGMESAISEQLIALDSLVAAALQAIR